MEFLLVPNAVVVGRDSFQESPATCYRFLQSIEQSPAQTPIFFGALFCCEAYFLKVLTSKKDWLFFLSVCSFLSNSVVVLFKSNSFTMAYKYLLRFMRSLIVFLLNFWSVQSSYTLILNNQIYLSLSVILSNSFSDSSLKMISSFSRSYIFYVWFDDELAYLAFLFLSYYIYSLTRCRWFLQAKRNWASWLWMMEVTFYYRVSMQLTSSWWFQVICYSWESFLAWVRKAFLRFLAVQALMAPSGSRLGGGMMSFQGVLPLYMVGVVMFYQVFSRGIVFNCKYQCSYLCYINSFHYANNVKVQQ